MSNSDDSFALVGILDLKEAKRIQSILADRGVRLHLLRNPETCSSGSCAPSVEVHAAPADLAKIREFFVEERSRSLAGLDFDPALVGEVFDPSKDSARCPACGTVFSTQLTTCPDCGLGFGGG